MIDALIKLGGAFQRMDIREPPILVVRSGADFGVILNTLIAEGAVPKGIIDPRADKIQVAGITIQHVPRKA